MMRQLADLYIFLLPNLTAIISMIWNGRHMVKLSKLQYTISLRNSWECPPKQRVVWSQVVVRPSAVVMPYIIYIMPLLVFSVFTDCDPLQPALSPLEILNLLLPNFAIYTIAIQGGNFI